MCRWRPCGRGCQRIEGPISKVEAVHRQVHGYRWILSRLICCTRVFASAVLPAPGLPVTPRITRSLGRMRFLARLTRSSIGHWQLAEHRIRVVEAVPLNYVKVLEQLVMSAYENLGVSHEEDRHTLREGGSTVGKVAVIVRAGEDPRDGFKMRFVDLVS